jgi:predicted acylesterase/phospholipase RssA
MRRRSTIALIAVFSLASASLGSLARAETVPFYEDSAILSVAEPIVVGEEAFLRRVSACAEGGEPFGLVLSGGSARAFAHIGVLEVMEEEGIRPDFVVADSMGAIIALLYGAGMAPADIAALFEAFPANELFDPEFPFSGGCLDSGRFIALVRALVGDLDIARLPVPTLVVCDDLLSRRQVLIAEGDFATVAAASFALPAVFEPIHFKNMLLIDGGATNLVPVEAAYRYSDRIAAATALYGRKLSYSSPFVVINRAFDIGKTRSSVEGILARRPLVIRCDVESLSYMQFSRISEVAARGVSSARAALDELKRLAPSGEAPSAALAERRAYYHERVARLAAAARLGADFPAPADFIIGADARFLDEAARGSEVFSGRRWLGPEAEFRAGPVRASISALAGLEGREDRAWGIGFETGLKSYHFPSREARESGLAFDADLRGVLSGSGVLDGGMSRPEPRELAATASGGVAFALSPRVVARPELGAEIDRDITEDDSFRRVSGGLGLKASPVSRLDLGLHEELEADSDGNLGQGSALAMDWEPAGVAALRLKGVYRSVFEGPGIEAQVSDAYRSAALEGRADRRFLCGMEVDWIARPLEVSFDEFAILERPELGLYADFSGADSVETDGRGFDTRLTIGAEASAGISIMGLAPMTFSAYVGAATDGSGWVLGLRAGRVFE